MKQDSTIKDIVDADLQEDGKTVILTLTDKIENGSTKNEVKVNVGKEATFEKLKALDSAFPTVVGVKLTGPKAVEVTFSEPVAKNGTPFTLKDASGKTIGVNSTVSLSANLEVMTLTTLVELKDGEYTLTIAGTDAKNVKDFAGYMVTAQDIKFDAVQDTTAPVAEVVKVETDAKANTTVVTVKFNKTMKTTGSSVGSPIANLKAKLGYNASSNAGVEVKSSAKTNEYTITITDVLAPGTHTMYLVGGTTTATKVKDTWGNILEDTTLSFEVVLDTEKPVVDSIVTEENNQFVVTFSEKVAGPKFVIKDAAGKSVTGFSAVEDVKNNKKWNITLKAGETFKGGVYTVEVKDAKDLSIFANKMDAVTVSVDTTDKVAPTVKSAGVVDGTIRVVFSEAMDESITEKANWALTGNKVKSVTLSDDAKSVVITLETKVVVATTIQVVNAKDLAGNKLGSGLVETITVAADTGKFTAKEAKLTGINEVTVVYEDNIVENIGDGVYTVTIDGEVYTEFETIDVNVVDGTDTVVVLKIKGGDATKEVTVSTKVKVVSTAALTNQYDQISDTAEITTVIDKAAPIMLGAEGANDANTITVNFSEELYAGSVQDSDFTVDGYSIKRVVANNDGTMTITLGTDEKLVAGEKLVIKLVGEVEDNANRNATTETQEIEFTVK